MPLAIALLAGLLLSSLIGYAAYQRGALSPSGVLGAVLTGTPIFGFGGIVAGTLLVAFFVSSSLLSQFKRRFKAQFSDTFQKTSQRDLGQALANGGWAAVLATGYGLSASQDTWLSILFFSCFVGAIAAVTADTWATEIGVLSAAPPRLVSTWRVVAPGTSGGVTVLGTAAALTGALFIGALAILGSWVVSLLYSTGISARLTPQFSAQLLVAAGLGGLGGAMFDSLLGATVQAMYYCDSCARTTEKRRHSCGARTRHVRGWRWLDNDLVNFLSSVFGSIVAGAAALAFL